jgi:two-component system, OmpR family, response regulator
MQSFEWALAMKSAPASDDRIDNEPAYRPRILFVGDDPTTRRSLANYLEQNDMRVTPVFRRQEVTRQFAIGEPNLVILDLPIGQEEGFDVLLEIRSSSDVPIIITSGGKRDANDRIAGLELGADDYLAKPFGLRELLARIRAVLRRSASRQAWSQRESEPDRFRFGDWQLDRRTKYLTHSRGDLIVLTKGEYALLMAFLNAPQTPLTRERLLNATRVHEDIFDRSIDVRVLRLRRKLEVDASTPHVIQTVRGFGYIFTLPVEPLATAAT